MSTAVLLLAYGSPNSLADLPAYLADIRGGRPMPPNLRREITRRYELIGGRSPLLDITRRAAARLQQALGLRVYVGMRHWHPYIRETVAQMAEEGIRRAVAICMAPHYSAMSIGAYRARLEEAAQGTPLSVDLVESWHTHPYYLAGVAANVQDTLVRFSPETRPRVHVLFTAHSLPATLTERGDPYEAQLHETANLLAERLDLPAGQWTLVYQSVPRAEGKWLGPQIEAWVPQLAQAGERNLLIAPIGFVAEHVEVLYDLDIGVQEIARTHGVRVERTPMLNDSPALIAALADLARTRLQAGTQEKISEPVGRG